MQADEPPERIAQPMHAKLEHSRKSTLIDERGLEWEFEFNGYQGYPSQEKSRANGSTDSKVNPVGAVGAICYCVARHNLAPHDPCYADSLLCSPIGLPIAGFNGARKSDAVIWERRRRGFLSRRI